MRDGHRFSTDDVLTVWRGTSWCLVVRTHDLATCRTHSLTLVANGSNSWVAGLWWSTSGQRDRWRHRSMGSHRSLRPQSGATLGCAARCRTGPEPHAPRARAPESRLPARSAIPLRRFLPRAILDPPGQRVRPHQPSPRHRSRVPQRHQLRHPSPLPLPRPFAITPAPGPRAAPARSARKAARMAKCPRRVSAPMGREFRNALPGRNLRPRQPHRDAPRQRMRENFRWRPMVVLAR